MKINPYILLIAAILLAPWASKAQEYSISGIVNDESSQPVYFANVVLLTPKDSIVINGSSTDEKGLFSLKNISQDSYILKVSFVGHKNIFKSITVDNDITLDSFVLIEDTEELSEVEIFSTKPTIKKEVDRLVFNIANTALTEGNMMDVLRSTPGILILENAITIKNTSPTVYINDRKVHLSGEELVQLLEGSSANSIKSIEVITNPPARYDAESGAVLNIVMSKNLVTGYSGIVFTNYTQGVFPRYNAGMTNFYKTDKISVFVNYSYTNSKINRESNERINFLEDTNIFERWNTNTNRVSRSKTHNINFNFDYFIDANNTLSLSSNLLFLPDFEYLTKGITQISDAQFNELSNFDSNNLSKDKKHNLGFDLDYARDFKNDAKLIVNAHFTTYDYNRKQDVLSNYFTQDIDPISTAFNTKANQNTNIFTSQIDYNAPINKTSSFSAGIKSSFIKTESDIMQFDIVNNEAVFNASNSDAFNYDENIYAAYLSYKEDWDTFSFSAGMRVEQTEIEGRSISTAQTNKRDYLEWFPTVNLSHKFTENINVYVNYKRSVERPSYQDLNPFRYFLNDNTIVTGNPNLNPAFTNHFVLGTSIKDKFTIEAYYKNIDAIFLELPIQNNEDLQLIYTPTNLTRTIDFGLDFITFFDVTENWFLYFVTSFYNTQDEAKFNNTVLKQDKWSNYSAISNDISFLKDKSLNANFTFTYVDENLQGFQEVETRYLTELSLKKTIFNKKGTLSLLVSDLLNKQDFSVSSKYLNQNNSNFFNEDNRYIKLGFSYKFGNATLKTNERTKDIKERERLEKKE